MGTNFIRACQIAYWKVRAARKKFATSKVVFNFQVLDVISQTRSQMEDELIFVLKFVPLLAEIKRPRRRMVLTRYESKSLGRMPVEGRFRGLQSLECVRKVLSIVSLNSLRNKQNEFINKNLELHELLNRLVENLPPAKIEN